MAGILAIADFIGQCRNSRPINRGPMQIQIKRAYAEVLVSDGKRILVDRLWPRGIKKQHA